jgi:predicted acylesterase/phospholipase RssA
MSTHTADAAALLEQLWTPPAVVVGTSAGAAIAVDLAEALPMISLEQRTPSHRQRCLRR